MVLLIVLGTTNKAAGRIRLLLHLHAAHARLQVRELEAGICRSAAELWLQASATKPSPTAGETTPRFVASSGAAEDSSTSQLDSGFQSDSTGGREQANAPAVKRKVLSTEREGPENGIRLRSSEGFDVHWPFLMR